MKIYYYENGNGVFKIINKSSKTGKYWACLHDQRIHQNLATTSV